MLKKKYILLFTFFLILLTNFSIFGQTGTIKFYIEQENGYFELLVNDTLVLRRHKDTLPVGKYHLKIWSQGYAVADTSFIIKENIETIHYQKLKRSDEYYSAVKAELIRNNKKSLIVRTPTYIGVGFTTLASFYAYRLNKISKEIDFFIRDYNRIGSTAGVQDFKDELILKEKGYNKVRRKFYTSLSFAIVSYGVALFDYSILNRDYPSQMGKFETEQSPFLKKLSLSFYPNSISLTLNI